MVDDHKWESLYIQVPTHAVCSFALSILELTVQSGGGWESFRYFFSHPHLFLYLHPIPILCKHWSRARAPLVDVRLGRASLSARLKAGCPHLPFLSFLPQMSQDPPPMSRVSVRLVWNWVLNLLLAVFSAVGCLPASSLQRRDGATDVPAHCREGWTR